MNAPVLNTQDNHNTCKHEWIADMSSLFAVILLFGSVFFIMHFHNATLEWMLGHSVLENIIAYTVLFFDAVLIVSLLCFGPTCREHNKSCFGTFKGRKH